MFRMGGNAEGITSGLDTPKLNASRQGYEPGGKVVPFAKNPFEENRAASMPSLKTDIEPIGKSSSGVNVYSFKYKGDDKTYQGVMAQEVPWASSIAENGYLQVDYSKVDVKFKRLN